MDARRSTRIALAPFAALLWLLTPMFGWADPPPAPTDLQFDAELTDVVFLDPDRGWAVGDRGTIMKTEDGGRSWRAQESPLGCRWENVYFVDERNGWIVGGWTQSRTWQSRGAMLRTRDGGQNWMPVPVATLPTLRRVRFLDERRGWALGDTSTLYPSGIFRTDDGGRSWTPVAGATGVNWLAGDFHGTLTGRVYDDSQRNRIDENGVPTGRAEAARGSHHSGVLIGHAGQLLLMTERESLELAVPAAGNRIARDLRFDARRAGWLVGDRGLILRTTDGGLSWQAPPAPIPPLAEQIDWSSVAILGDRCWIVGAPGTSVLTSGDGGKSWELLRTGQTTPLKSVVFFDEHHGWAAGALGTILMTRDGGRSWRRQRGGGHLAVLALFGDAERLPLELMSQLCGSDGYLGAAEILFDRTADSPRAAQASWATRTQAALVSAGASLAHTTNQFPAPPRGLVRQADTIVQQWDQQQARPSLDALDAYLVRLIRQWRPEIVVTEAPLRKDADPLDPLVYHAVMMAVQRAGQADVYPDQISQLGLEPWRAKKMFHVTGEEERGSIALTTTQLSPRWGRSLADMAAAGRGLLTQQPTAVPSTLGFRLAIDHMPQELGRRDFMSGIALTAGGDGRRLAVSTARGDLNDLGRVAQKQRNIQQLLARASGNQAQTEASLGQLDELSRGMGKSAAGDMLWQLAERFQQAGQHELAAQTLRQLLKRDPRHEMADAALLWLVQYNASEELTYRRQRAQAAIAKESAIQQAGVTLVSPVRRTGQNVRPEDAAASGATEQFQVRPPELPGANGSAGAVGAVQPATALIPVESQRRPDALIFAEQLERGQPAWSTEPALRLPLAALQRRTAPTAEADPMLRAIANARGLTDWSACAQGELWLSGMAKANSRSNPPNQRPVARLSSQTSRPRLDGQLDDAIWKHAARLRLHLASDTADTARVESSDTAEAVDDSSLAWIACDGEYLYVAARVRRVAADAARHPSVRPPGTRTRDADLRARDRVQFVLDVDRDYTTAYQLTIDEFGWTAESCWGDATWNPNWYVAAHDNEDSWTIEAAIPWEELVARPPQSGDAWAIQVQRMTPGAELRAWSHPASLDSRLDGLGWLLFE